MSDEQIKVEGVVEAVKKDGKGFKVGENWYAAYKASMLSGAVKGSQVRFEYKKNGNWNNIVGTVEVLGQAATGQATPPANDSGGRRASSFPIPILSGERAIIRQNALGHAVNVWKVSMDVTRAAEQILSLDHDRAADSIVKLARKFEAYACGDIDRAEAEAMAQSTEA